MTKAQLPPVPPQNRSPHGSATSHDGQLSPQEVREARRDRNPEQEGRQGNTHQNTTHQGYQQDR
ncbi:hypothetical protein LPC08_09920 [Roseomonas sp. OT10]|uniref:hypothetical protein n=1 Tax=Roseomonas cutis TaxID=2897332 RepID=UPI001E631F03|nr:hypothetical protein [Roseomonas sp. OT10]UFN50897.1 hypothetical protein LPC08_09920 [Roseomonas sp. OT10]